MDRAINLRAQLRGEFRRHVHAILAAGYSRMNSGDYATSEEPTITGDLVNAMIGRKGKSRPRIDIQVVRTQKGDRPRFGWEAKRLGNGHSVGTYLGCEGMLALLNEYYPSQNGEAGMLGYVQSSTVESWRRKIAHKMSDNPQRYFFEGLGAERLTDSLDTYRSRHTVADARKYVWHSLFLFH